MIIAQLGPIDGGTACGDQIKHWPDKPQEDAMPLRLTSGLQILNSSGKERRLTDIYEGR